MSISAGTGGSAGTPKSHMLDWREVGNGGSPSTQGLINSGSSAGSRVSWASKLQKSLSNSFGLATSPVLVSLDESSTVRVAREYLCQANVEVSMLTANAAPPFTSDLQGVVWRENCTVSVERIGPEAPNSSYGSAASGSPALLDEKQPRPYVLVTHLDRKSMTVSKRRISDDSLPPAIINLEDIVYIHPVSESTVDMRGRKCFGCIIEAITKGHSLFFASHRDVKLCIRFQLKEDLVEWVAALKSAIALTQCSCNELLSLYHVLVPAHQRVLSQQHALLAISPPKPQPRSVQLLHPLTMLPLYEVALENIMAIGQRFDAKQLWVSVMGYNQEMSMDISLHCQCVGQLVKTLKAALQQTLDWGEELVTNSSKVAVSHIRQRTSSSSAGSRLSVEMPAATSVLGSPGGSAGSAGSAGSMPSVGSLQQVSFLADRERLATPSPTATLTPRPDGCLGSTAGTSNNSNDASLSGNQRQGDGGPQPPPLPPKPGQSVPDTAGEADEVSFADDDDDLDDMTEMNPMAIAQFSEIPSSVFPPLNSDMLRSSPFKSLTLPCVRSKPRSRSSNLLDETQEPEQVDRLSRSYSMPGEKQDKARVRTLSNRARLLPDDQIDLDQVSLLSDASLSASRDQRNSTGSSAEGRPRGDTRETVYVMPPMAIEDPA